MQNITDIYNAIIGIGIGLLIGLIVLDLVLLVIFLMIGLKAVNGQKRGFGSVFVTSLLNWIVSIIPILGCILQWVIINARHKTGFGKAILAWLIAIIIPWVIIIIILVVAGVAGNIFNAIMP